MAIQDDDFKVSDRRIFDHDGEVRNTPEAPTEAAPQTAPDPNAASRPSTDKQEDLVMTFQTLVLSLSTTAMLQLGLLANPVTGKSEKDLVGAKQTIDILQILKDKTRGNLSAEESQLLEASVYDLQMTYLQVTEKISL